MTRPQNCGSGFCSCVECHHRIAWGNTTDRILLLLAEEPMTKAEICRRLELTHDQVSNVLSRLRRTKRIYIAEYTRHAVWQRMYLRAVYAVGSKPDAPKMAALTPSERSSRSHRKKMLIKKNVIFRSVNETHRPLEG